MKFNLDDYVRMRDFVVTPYRSHVGRIVGMKLNERGKQALDKYTVRFPDGETVEVWGIQLESVRKPSTAAHTSEAMSHRVANGTK